MSVSLKQGSHPPRAIPPGEHIAMELDARGWTQADLARIMARPVQTINQIIRARKSITPETAIGLGAAFGTGPEFWMNLETRYRLHPQVRAACDEKAIVARARAHEKALTNARGTTKPAAGGHARPRR